MKLTNEERAKISRMGWWSLNATLDAVDEVLEARGEVPQAPHCINCLRFDDTGVKCPMCRGLDMSTFHAYALSVWQRLQAEVRRARQDGWQEGFREGYQEAYADRYNEGKALESEAPE